MSTVLPVLSSAKPSETSAAPEPSATAPSTAEASSPASSSPATPAQPVYTNTNARDLPRGSADQGDQDDQDADTDADQFLVVT